MVARELISNTGYGRLIVFIKSRRDTELRLVFKSSLITIESQRQVREANGWKVD